MRNKLALCSMMLMLCVGSSYAATPEVSARFKVDQATAIPGGTLQPGSYSLQVVDHLSDRYILRVDGGSASQSSFLGIPNAALKGAPGAIKWGKSPNDNTYLKGWNFGSAAGAPGALEFVYPKDDAVALAKANGTRVAAIDPASEGRVTNNGLSKEDMQMVTLWLLSPTHVGPVDAAGIKAERYQQVASAAHKPVVARLPHTASLLPLAALSSLLFVLFGAGLRFASPKANL